MLSLGDRHRSIHLLLISAAIAAVVVGAIVAIGPRETGVTPEPEVAPAIRLPVAEPTVRVRIGTLSTSSPVELTGFGGTLTVTSGTSMLQIPGAGVIRILSLNGMWDVALGSETRSLGDAAVPVDISWDGPPPGVDRGDGSPPRRYPGSLRITAGDRIQLINVVGMETYLPGVIAGEMPDSWEPAALEAQAIAARSYACYQIAHRGGDALWHVGDSPLHQVYHGEVGAAAARRAVASTYGVILSWKGSLVPGWYSSCCGGFPAAASDVFDSTPVTMMPPLQGHGGRAWCTASPRWQWQIERPASTLARRLVPTLGEGSSGDEPPNVTSITIASRSRHHRPTTLTVSLDSGDTETIGATRLRRLANATPPGLSPPSQRLYSSNLTGRQEDGVVQISGRGWGHGVGLCQWGAQAQATAGRTTQGILEFYYPDATLHRAW